jgi:hypothetical protein
MDSHPCAKNAQGWGTRQCPVFSKFAYSNLAGARREAQSGISPRSRFAFCKFANVNRKFPCSTRSGVTYPYSTPCAARPNSLNAERDSGRA